MKHSPQQPIPPHILAESADWLMCLNEGELSPQQQQDFIHWQHASADHARAWQKAQRLLQNFEHIPGELAMSTLNRPNDPSRRAAMLKLALVIGAIPLMGTSYYHLTREQAGYVSKMGQQRTITLPDGSELLLNTDTQLDVHYQPQQRLIELHRGEILVQTANNISKQLGQPMHAPSKRPFKVQLNNIQLEALGTRFIVRTASTHQQKKQHYLGVLEGAVRISLHASQTKPSQSRYLQDNMVINAGQQVYFSDKGIQPATPITAVSSAWSNGMLMADNQPLTDFVAELSRYRRGFIQIDPAIRNLAVSGSFPLDNIEQTLTMLSATYPVNITHRFGLYWVAIAPKSIKK